MTRKRKKSKQSPGEEKQFQDKRRERKQKQTMDTEKSQRQQTGQNDSSYIQINTPQTPQPHYNSPGISYVQPSTPGTYQVWSSIPPGVQQTGQPTPSPQNTLNGDVVSLLLARLDSMDNKLVRLDSIQSSVDSINNRMKSMDNKISDLETKVRDMERSREFDSETLNQIGKQHKELDGFMQRVQKLEEERRQTESALKSEILDLKSRSMRDNLLFHGIPEEKDENCEAKILNFIQETMKVEDAVQHVRLQRAHRIGPYRAGKTRPMVAKFTDFHDREKVRRAARELKGTHHGVSEQFPREIVDQRRKLIPIMLQARKDGKEAYLRVDKLYISGQLYRGEQ